MHQELYYIQVHTILNNTTHNEIFHVEGFYYIKYFLFDYFNRENVDVDEEVLQELDIIHYLRELQYWLACNNFYYYDDNFKATIMIEIDGITLCDVKLMEGRVRANDFRCIIYFNNEVVQHVTGLTNVICVISNLILKNTDQFPTCWALLDELRSCETSDELNNILYSHGDDIPDHLDLDPHWGVIIVIYT